MINRKRCIVFDDGGMLTSNPDNSGFKIGFVVYERLLKLAQQNEIKIPIACTASFFDINYNYKESKINPDAERILRLIEENNTYLELWNHGLTHMIGGAYTEFDLYSKESVSEHIQKEKLRLSQMIFASHPINVNSFVPPGHAWENGITDKLASKFGIENIAVREFEKTSIKDWVRNPLNKYKKQWKESKILKTYFRLGLGIRHDQTIFKRSIYRKSGLYIKNSFPTTILSNRKIRLKYPVDHFFAHVQNLMGNQSLEYFDFVIKEIKKSRNI